MDAKSVLKSAAPNFTSGLASNNMLVLELDRRDDEREIQSALNEITGKAIVPSVWVGGKFIGGSTETRDLYEVGKLQQLVQSVIS
jgi:glutaredoxin 3